MSDTTLFTLGTPFGQWQGVVQSFLGEAGALDPAVGRWHRDVVGNLPPAANGFEPAAMDRIEVSAEMLARLHALRPSAALWGGADAALCWTAHALAGGFPTARFLVWVDDPARSLAHWLSAPGQGDPAHLLAIFESAAQSIVRLVHRHLPRCLVVHTDEALAHPAALARKLKDWMGLEAMDVTVSGTPQPDPLQAVLAERLVASHGGVQRAYQRLYASCVPLAPGRDVPAAPAHAMAAVAAYRDLAERAASGAALAPQLQAAQQEGQRLRDALGQATRDGDRVLAQLHQTQEELEATFLKHQALSAEVTRVRQESELMLVQLHQVQEELEHYYLAYRDLEASAAKRSEGTWSVEVERVEITAERDTPPHRELALMLAGVRAPDRAFARVDARLVEHHGRPGLALFAAAEGVQPLMAWQPTGTEADRAYMLFVPADEQTSHRLQRLGTADWQFTRALASHIVRSLEAADAVPVRWRVAASRLLRQLAGTPPRWRFDSVAISRDADAEEAFIVAFGNVSFGDRCARELRLRWRPDAPEGAAPVDLLAPDSGDEGLILAGWPVDEEGTWRAAWPVPLAGAPRRALEHEWRAMPPDDRELLLGLLDALPAAARRAVGTDTVDAGRGVGLLLAAARPLQTAHRLLHGNRLRRTVRALRGRLF